MTSLNWMIKHNKKNSDKRSSTWNAVKIKKKSQLRHQNDNNKCKKKCHFEPIQFLKCFLFFAHKRNVSLIYNIHLVGAHTNRCFSSYAQQTLLMLSIFVFHVIKTCTFFHQLVHLIETNALANKWSKTKFNAM